MTQHAILIKNGQLLRYTSHCKKNIVLNFTNGFNAGRRSDLNKQLVLELYL